MLSFNLSLEEWGNIFLAPVRVLFHGRNVQIVRSTTGGLSGIHHVASFHRNGAEHRCRTNDTFTSEQASWILTLMSIVWLVPCLIIGSMLKGTAYFTEATRKRHALAKKHFTPQDLQIGSPQERVSEPTEAFDLSPPFTHFAPYNQKVRSLTIWGDGTLTLSADYGLIRPTNPKKIYLIDTHITHVSSITDFDELYHLLASGNLHAIDDTIQAAFGGHLDAALVLEGKFEVQLKREENDTFVVQHDMPSLKAAETDRLPRGVHRIYCITTK